nr:MAG TPA: hypothetical protein [Caudoviricetes sp.]
MKAAARFGLETPPLSQLVPATAGFLPGGRFFVLK